MQNQVLSTIEIIDNFPQPLSPPCDDFLTKDYFLNLCVVEMRNAEHLSQSILSIRDFYFKINARMMSDTYTDENKSLNQKGKKTKSLAESFGTRKRENKNRDCQVLKSIRAFFKSVKKMLPMESCDEF